MTSFRLNFIEVDSSVESVSSDDTIKGYMVIRAPKGTTEPMYFDSGNQNIIESMLGVGTAHWSDINEATAFNAEFGLWISAPPGSGSDYSSYYGGVYLTKNGVFPFYQCSNKEDPNWLTEIALGSETALAGSSSEIAVIDLSNTKSDPVVQGQFRILGVPAKVYSSLSYLTLDFWGSDFNNSKAGIYKIGIENGNLYPFNSEGTLLSKSIGTVERNSITNTYTFTLGGSDSSIESTDTEYPFFTFDELVDYSGLSNENGVLSTTDADALKSLIVNGGSTSIGIESYQSVSGLESRIKWITSVKNDTYMYITQKTPTEKVTNITISDIGYDKYNYNLALEYAYDFSESSSPVYPSNENNLFAIVKATSGYETGIYQKVVTTETVGGSTVNKISYVNVTEDYETQYVRLIGLVDGSAKTSISRAYENTLRIVSGGTLLEVGPDQANQAQTNLNFNSIIFSVTEEVHPGELQSGGEFKGSLDESGTDEYGTNIYWPEVLPDDAFSFIEVVPVKTFDDDVDANGFFTGTRIVDLYGPEVDSYTAYVQGQRYMTHLVQQNIDNGLIGNVWQESMYNVIRAGWTEAFLPKYWDAHVFMEPTGCETLKATLASLRKTQKLSTVISKKTISTSEAANPNKIVVSGRMEGTAQYVGEFMAKCPYTYKKYYFSPIGDIGVNLCRIIDTRLGGVAPAGTNETGGIGGGLARSVLSARYDFDDDIQKVFNTKGLNPICYDSTNGLVLMGHRTTLDTSSGLSDWAYLGHTMAFDLCRREICDQVMIPQLFKAIDDYWMTARERTLRNILDQRTTGSRPIWAETFYDIKGQQTASTKAKRNFMILVKVKVNVYSEFVTLIFENVGQSVSLS